MIASPGVGREFPVVPTLDPDREASPDFQTSYLVGKDEETVEVIYLGEVDSGKHLVVVPHQAWHRQGAKRKLTGLTKPLPLDVACCTVSAREEMLEDPMMKVWMGIASDLVISNLQIVVDKDTRDSLTCPFGVAGDPGYLPHVVALAQLAQEQFNFVSAESALEGGEREAAHLPVPAEHGLPAGSLQTRVDQLEASLGSIQATLTTLVDRLPAAEEKRVTFAPKPKIIPTSPKSSTRTTKPTSSRYPSCIGPRRGGGCNQCRSGGPGVGGHAKNDEFKPEWIEKTSGTSPPTFELNPAPEDPGRSSFGIRGRSRRRWIAGWLFRRSSVVFGKADGDLDVVDGGEGSEVKSFEGRLGSGFHLWWQSWGVRCRRRWSEASSSSSPCTSTSPSRPSRGYQCSFGEVDAGGLNKHSARPWGSTSNTFSTGVGRIQEPHRLLSYGSLLRLVCRRNLRRPHPRAASPRSGKSSSFTSTTGPDGDRPWQLDVIVRIGSGARTSFLHVVHPHVAAGWRGRKPVQPSFRRSLGRDLSLTLTRCRRFHFEAEGLGQEDRRCGQGEGRQQGRQNQQSEGQSKGQGRLGRAYGSMMHEAVDSRADNGVVVPGSRAPTVVVPALMNSLGRVILRYGDRLALFCRSILAAKPSSRDEGARSLSLWPIPVPYPEAFRKEQGGGSLWRKRRVSLQILVFDWMFLGQPSVAPPCLKLGMRLSGRQWERIRLLEHLSEDSNSLFEVDAETMSRAAAKTEAASDELDALHRALTTSEQFSFGRCGYSGGGANVSPFDVDLEEEVFPFGCFEGEMAAKEFVVAKEIEADRVSFVGKPSFDPRPYFDETTTFAYDKPLERSKDFESLEPPPRVHVHANPLERKKLFRAMAQTDRLIALSEEEVRSDRLAGLFCVPKSLSKDRLILDSRPANGAEPPLSRWTSTMAAYSCLAGIELNDDEELRLSGRDISDYFYQFKVSKERGLRNVMSCWLSAEELEFIFDKPFSRGGFVGLNTLAMGDLAACEFAQCAHLENCCRVKPAHPWSSCKCTNPPLAAICCWG